MLADEDAMDVSPSSPAADEDDALRLCSALMGTFGLFFDPKGRPLFPLPFPDVFGLFLDPLGLPRLPVPVAGLGGAGSKYFGHCDFVDRM
jgi:hypothetical protein